ncbi:class I SAM-dependent methyltransferase [Sinorhizobium meliloti WSM1022]|jgi:predicted TPR repeat methyltransferase|uniref:class I SAM-dependent DNA methyltransferase n=1 Tax=Rhizobium meliloti TaxID=382 RepID=UPI00042342F2|nr:class I SAM-dependent methyltransferase [Sinorhizobium meliloti]ASQ05115.1 SAM-dependent methyltransferase [Sinorhizobium meliloti]MCO6422184.1 class I SAM-dependent methyltransferase [Sinorhizobium meliloti]MDW9407951.1 methyltransferase domain-containing protein [Sinorhizobium meliloti]MDW9439981.1 methyltransferase domain-containing protein [Sinorhizobium meliloti]MDW9454759.1 methyltransferase domain-containing protein [Sinorhizobium meliloti]
MTFNQLSSGDLIADRRADYAKMLAEAGDAPGAAELMAQALELAPDWAAGWFRLADYEEKSGRIEAAVDALRHTLRLNPEDIFGASLKLALLGATETPEQPPSVYVERLFDDYAERFDHALVEKLGYSVPEKLAAVIGRVNGGGRFRHVTDLGCGTGLFGERIRDRADFLEGFDLSANMLAKAEAKGVYDRLAQADLSLAPEDSGVFGALEQGRADLVSAADVLMYLGNLEGVFFIADRLLASGGLFAFSVEDACGADGFVLRPSLRYAHSEAYIASLCKESGLSMIATERTIIRRDAGEPVDGILFLACKPA